MNGRNSSGRIGKAALHWRDVITPSSVPFSSSLQRLEHHLNDGVRAVVL